MKNERILFFFFYEYLFRVLNFLVLYRIFFLHFESKIIQEFLLLFYLSQA